MLLRLLFIIIAVMAVESTARPLSPDDLNPNSIQRDRTTFTVGDTVIHLNANRGDVLLDRNGFVFPHILHQVRQYTWCKAVIVNAGYPTAHWEEENPSRVTMTSYIVYHVCFFDQNGQLDLSLSKRVHSAIPQQGVVMIKW